jgi:putative ABC transport system ATP-binding protein
LHHGQAQQHRGRQSALARDLRERDQGSLYDPGRPELILADEPTANLDSKTGAELLDMMHDLNHKTGMTFLFSTHDPMVMERAERVVTLLDGRVVNDERRGSR